MSILRVYPTGWAVGEKLTSAQMNGVDLSLTYAADKRAGIDSIAATWTATGAGRLVGTYAIGADANTTYLVTGANGTIDVSGLTADRVYTLGDTGAVSNDRIFILNRSGKTVTIKNASAVTKAVLGSLASGSGTGAGEDFWVEMIFTAAGWVVAKSNAVETVNGMGTLATLNVSAMPENTIRHVSGVGTYLLTKDAGNIALFGDVSISRTPHYIIANANAGVWMLCANKLPITQRLSPIAEYQTPGAAATVAGIKADGDFGALGTVIQTMYGFRAAHGTAEAGQRGYLCDLTPLLATYRGMRLKEVTLRLWPAGGHAALPQYMPQLGVWRQSKTGADVFGSEHLATAFAVDGSADVTAYQTNHFIRITTLTASPNIIQDGYTYALTFFSEGGTNSDGGIYVPSFELTLGL